MRYLWKPRLHTKLFPMYGASKRNLAFLSWDQGSRSSSHLHCALHLREFVLIAKQATFGSIRYGNTLQSRWRCRTDSIVTSIVMCRPNKHPRPQSTSRSHGRNLQPMPTRLNLARARSTRHRIPVALFRKQLIRSTPAPSLVLIFVNRQSCTTRPERPHLPPSPPTILRTISTITTLVQQSLGRPRSRSTTQSHLLPRLLHLSHRRALGRYPALQKLRRPHSIRGLRRATTVTRLPRAERDHAPERPTDGRHR